VPLLHRYRKTVGESAHPAQRAEVVIERSVFLHEDDDVLDIANRPRSPVRGDGERFADGRGKGEVETRGPHAHGASQEVTSIAGGHVETLHGRAQKAGDVWSTVQPTFGGY